MIENITKDVFLTKDDKVEIVSMIKDTKSDIIKWMFIFLGRTDCCIDWNNCFIFKKRYPY